MGIMWVVLGKTKPGGSQHPERWRQFSAGRPAWAGWCWCCPGRAGTGQWETKTARCWASAQHPLPGPGSAACRSPLFSWGIKITVRFSKSCETESLLGSGRAGIKAALHPGRCGEPGSVARWVTEGARPGWKLLAGPLRTRSPHPGRTRRAPWGTAPRPRLGAGRARPGSGLSAVPCRAVPHRAVPHRAVPDRASLSAGRCRRRARPGRARPHRRPRRGSLPRDPPPLRGAAPAPPCGGVPGALRFSHKSEPSPWERAILHRALLTENEKQTGPEINHGAQRLHKGRLCVNRAGRGGQLPAARVRTGPGPRASGLPGAAGQVGAARRGPPAAALGPRRRPPLAPRAPALETGPD